ncbi:Utp25p [Saccharomyces cerevisiae YJM1078]|nr:Utp25p [Saccharomyces cerevisiae YJM1078]AJR37403.1 Utp25p [Saccharomyces cerevisiae YJM248]CAI4384676.1 CPG_1a_G0026540.mRNA.1.CDS.1 [Saccharomyces cerevisiae]CAI4395786.1 AIE_G0026550.mRNA.1.CDS.1 [Saccharomyces cerevisiae]CAI6602409.1 AIE_G0026550.mRNA.1.CDS.1 [Saccharomyces cerevisiae]
MSDSSVREKNDNFRGYRKRGRQELRKIKRSSARTEGGSTETLEDVAEDIDHRSDEDEVSDVDSGDDFDIEDEEGKKEKVYDALLTILKSEHPEPKRRRREADESNKAPAEVGEDEHENTEHGPVDDQLEIENGLLGNHEDDNDDDSSEDEKDIDSEDEQDPFESHFNQVPEKFVDELSNAFKTKSVKYKSVKGSLSDSESYIYAKPVVIGEEALVESPYRSSSIYSYFLKQRLKVQNGLLDKKTDPLTALQKKLVDPMFQYKDILYEYDSYEKDEDEYRDLYALHVLNHIYKTRDRILKNNQRLQDNPDTEHLDQGFTRPKVLIVVPTREVAYRVVDKIISKSGIDQVDKKGKFYDQFRDDSLPPKSKPKSFQHIFRGNTNDFFVVGLKFTRKAIKLYSNFYQSDIIVCSPLGIQMILENTDKKKRQDDFLSSIELMVIDQLHSIEYQNISHIFAIFDHLNKIPDQQHEADFSRIRMWYINEQAKLFRQTMVFTKYISPAANSLINGRCRNMAGRWKNHKIIGSENSSIGQSGLKIRQIFQRFDIIGNSIIEEPDYRFKFFTSVIIPGIVKSTGYEDGILIYIPDYTDFIRIRNYMKEKTTILFGDINEYSSQRQLNANRSLFQQGRLKVMLYTERLHHYRRYEIKGVKSIVFYKPPNNPEFYNEVVRFIGKNAFLGNTDLNISTVRCIYSKLDGLSLERIVGTKRAAVLSHAQKEIYEFK